MRRPGFGKVSSPGSGSNGIRENSERLVRDIGILKLFRCTTGQPVETLQAGPFGAAVAGFTEGCNVTILAVRPAVWYVGETMRPSAGSRRYLE